MNRLYGLLAVLSVSACQAPFSQTVEQAARVQVLEVSASELGATPHAQRDQEFEMLCAGWQLNAQQIEQFFTLARESAAPLEPSRQTLPCRVQGQLLADKEHWVYSVSATGQARLQREGRERHFICQHEACADWLLSD